MKNFQQFIVDSSQSIELDHAPGASNDTLFDSDGDEIDKWINCDAQRIWFNDIEIIAEWMAWEDLILQSKDELIFVNPKRWELYWEPRLIRYQNILTLAAGVDRKNARALAKNIVLPPLS